MIRGAKKILLIGIAVASGLCWSDASASMLTGLIVDSVTDEPVPAATIRMIETGVEMSAGEDGTFTIPQAPEHPLELVVRHVAYHPWHGMVTPSPTPETIRLEPLVVRGKDIVVTSTRAIRGQSPVAFENLRKEDLERAHYAQDLPVILAESPGVYTSSDNGNGIGYSYLSVRGFPQRRVSVLVNGVPLNDPESHEVYWIDLPNLTENVEDIQVQRGVGTTLYGSNSIGGTINIVTQTLSPQRQVTVSSGFGSYGTRKFSVAFNSGLIEDKHAIYGRYSRIVSDGYRRGAWTDLWSYFFSAARYDEKWTNQLNIFGGPEQTHLAYKGIPRWYINGDTTFWKDLPADAKFGSRPTGDPDRDRRYNPFEWEGETDNFNQPQYQWTSEYRPNARWRLENTLYYIKGRGFYDQLRDSAQYKVYQLPPVQLVDGADTITLKKAGELWRRRWVENDFWGLVPRATFLHRRGQLSAGFEVNRLTADHWAQVQSVRPAPPDFTPGQRYYDYDGRKTVASLFAEEVFQPDPVVTITAALQYSFKRYELDHNRYPNDAGQRVQHATDYSVFSPRLGVAVKPIPWMTLFSSVSSNRLEPTNDEIYDAAAYEEANAYYSFNTVVERGDGILLGRDPTMRPERLINYEFGAALSRDRWRADVNLFHMRFHDEIVGVGRLTDDGVPVRANAPTTIHQGIELAGRVDMGFGFSASGNLSINDNTFHDYIELVPDWNSPDWPPPVDTVSRDGNPIAGFPKHLANLRLNYDHRYFGLSAHLFRAGQIYLDNTNSPSASIAPYTLVDGRVDLRLQRLVGGQTATLFVQVNNIFDKAYETGGYIDDGYPLFLPAAGRNAFAGLKFGL